MPCKLSPAKLELLVTVVSLPVKLTREILRVRGILKACLLVQLDKTHSPVIPKYASSLHKQSKSPSLHDVTGSVDVMQVI